jgi:hypothetical protein
MSSSTRFQHQKMPSHKVLAMLFPRAARRHGTHLLAASAPGMLNPTWSVREFAGHSKWHNIQHKKGKLDVKRAAAFQKACVRSTRFPTTQQSNRHACQVAKDIRGAMRAVNGDATSPVVRNLVEKVPL